MTQASWYPKDKCIHELFEEQVATNPTAIALVHEEETLSYEQLNKQANQLAHRLIEEGVVPDTLVGICVERSIEMVVGLLGILKAGGAYVALDPNSPEARLRYMLDDSGVSIVLSQKGIASDLPVKGQLVLCLDDQSLYAEQPWTDINRQSQGLRPDHLAYVIYTSGTTGRPKGVLVEHDNVVRLFRASETHFDFNEHDVWTLFHSYAFDFSVWELWGGLCHGARVVSVPYWVSRSSQDFYELVAREGVTVLNQTPSAFRQFEAEDSASTTELSLRYVIFGGEVLDAGSVERWQERHGDRRPELVNMYGITETTVHVTYQRLEKGVARGGSIGRALGDLQVRILQGQGEPVPLGVSGELYIGGGGVARGYLNQPELSAERFIRDPYSDQADARLYKTGDLGSWNADGSIGLSGAQR